MRNSIKSKKKKNKKKYKLDNWTLHLRRRGKCLWKRSCEKGRGCKHKYYSEIGELNSQTIFSQYTTLHTQWKIWITYERFTCNQFWKLEADKVTTVRRPAIQQAWAKFWGHWQFIPVLWRSGQLMHLNEFYSIREQKTITKFPARSLPPAPEWCSTWASYEPKDKTMRAFWTITHICLSEQESSPYLSTRDIQVYSSKFPFLQSFLLKHDDMQSRLLQYAPANMDFHLRAALTQLDQHLFLTILFS